MNLHCKNCGMEIAAEHVNLENLVAKCRGCNSVFSFAQEVGADPSRIVRKPVRRGAIPKPRGVRISEYGEGLKIVQRWFSPKYIGMLFFCIAWDSFLVFWYFIAFTQKAPWIMIVFPIAHVAVGVGLTYATLAGFINRSVVSVSYKDVTVRHGPLPWAGGLSLETRKLDQLFTQEEANNRENGSEYTFQLSALLTDGRKVKLLSKLPSSDAALYIEQQIESRLRIEDRPVQGEIPRER